RSFNSQRALEQHEDNSSMHNICDACDVDFSKWSQLVQHWLQSPYHDYCERCDEHFDSPDDLQDHFEEEHTYCDHSERVFDSDQGLHDHRRQSHPDIYCVSCRRMFRNENNLDHHLRSTYHRGRDYDCPGSRCNRAFVSRAAMIQHWETGSMSFRCHSRPSALDRCGLITNPTRLLGSSDAHDTFVMDEWATELSWNGSAYECYACRRTFRTLNGLNSHLHSPAHLEEIYTCPYDWNGCGKEFKVLSAFCQHVESEHCGILRFSGRLNRVIDSISSSRRLTMW
ncbi:hypothetical protein CERSUDRAFT_55850, partial [Gelatoporia subvermispora B]